MPVMFFSMSACDVRPPWQMSAFLPVVAAVELSAMWIDSNNYLTLMRKDVFIIDNVNGNSCGSDVTSGVQVDWREFEVRMGRMLNNMSSSVMVL